MATAHSTSNASEGFSDAHKTEFALLSLEQNICPVCGEKLGVDMRYVGGRGYRPLTFCLNIDCEYFRWEAV